MTKHKYTDTFHFQYTCLSAVNKQNALLLSLNHNKMWTNPIQ